MTARRRLPDRRLAESFDIEVAGPIPARSADLPTARLANCFCKITNLAAKAMPMRVTPRWPQAWRFNSAARSKFFGTRCCAIRKAGHQRRSGPLSTSSGKDNDSRELRS
jgi:hypothetical protein